jgi:hypothetical protein
MMPDKQSDQLCINTIRTLSMDAVQAKRRRSSTEAANV